MKVRINLLRLIGSGLVKKIEGNNFRGLGEKINYHHEDGRKVVIKIQSNCDNPELKIGDEIIVQTPSHLFGATLKQRYREAVDILKNPTSGTNQEKIFIKKSGKKLEPINDFLEIDQSLSKEEKKKALNNEIMPIETPAYQYKLKSDFSLYQKKENGEVEKIQDNVKQVTLGALYKTSNILNQEVQAKKGK